VADKQSLDHNLITYVAKSTKLKSLRPCFSTRARWLP